ncbi:hypothetical protein KUL72_07140 [Bradyrhizobium arachidis]|uniref:hypothetical protein n=1 Tax=Bradyrhizobium TaxID=374 RepID=UPI00188A077E|nr:MULTISPECIES: hypothetical protein [Bradyrhizobium]MDN4987977.1 hypothetical protein [Bradyrhizobium sp. WYCCWR 13022]UVO38141.1 hypothetical protein KUL72_07140 [Bradyrhizobium arachidis]
MAIRKAKTRPLFKKSFGTGASFNRLIADKGGGSMKLDFPHAIATFVNGFTVPPARD